MPQSNCIGGLEYESVSCEPTGFCNDKVMEAETLPASRTKRKAAMRLFILTRRIVNLRSMIFLQKLQTFPSQEKKGRASEADGAETKNTAAFSEPGVEFWPRGRPRVRKRFSNEIAEITANYD